MYLRICEHNKNSDQLVHMPVQAKNLELGKVKEYTHLYLKVPYKIVADNIPQYLFFLLFFFR